jgi:DNA-directed RNA polymerase beta' subunit
MKQQIGIFWKNHDDAPAWAKSAGEQLSVVLGPVFEGGLTVELNLPNAEDALRKVAANLELLGGIELGWSAVSDRPLRIEVPTPYHGVFVKHREDSGMPGLAVWASWLGELPGFRYLRKPGNSKKVFWRLGLAGGGYVQAHCGKLDDDQKKRAFPDRLRILPPRSAWPQFLHAAYDLKGWVDIPTKREPDKAGGFWGLVHDLAVKNKPSKEENIMDEDDLDCRVLVTFPVWLKAKLAEAMLAAVLEVAGNGSTEVIRAFSGKGAVDTAFAKVLWEKLVKKEQAEVLAMRLHPPGWSRGPASEGKKRFVPLQWIEPVNPVDLVALLTQVRRYPLAHESLEMLPAAYRQNHPSFRGRICPVQSPESELVGLSLHLACGATVDWEGRITPADSSRPQEELGFGASLIPFYEHNDGARCMMGAKNLRQAVPVAKRQAPLVMTGGELAIQEFAKPLIEVGICPDAADSKGAPALGVDLLVAYLPWKGLNVDDAIVVGKHVVGNPRMKVVAIDGRVQTAFEEGMLDIQISKRFRLRLKPGWVPTSLGRSTVLEGEMGGLAIEGSALAGGDLIAAFGLQGAEDRVKWDLRYKDRSPAILKSIRFQRAAEWMGGALEYELVKSLKLGLGDKLMGRHGNKGVVGAILPSDQMPRLPDDQGLPAELRGRPIDILLNPHGVISRMNLGQLLETHVGWLLKAGCKQEQFAKEGTAPDDPIGQPFLGALDHAKVQQLLESSGLDRFGRIRLLLPDGTMTLSPVIVGFQHIVRLKHVPELKSQARRGGEGAVYSRDTGQAVHGRVIGGGQRIGEMEVWALAGHQANYILEEMLGIKADSMLTRQLAKTNPKDAMSTFEGFSQRLKDWLFALLIDLRVEDGKVSMSFVDPAQACKSIGENKRVLNSESVRKMVLASFSCQSKVKGGCPFELLDGERIAVEEPITKSKQASVKLNELLDHLGFAAGETLVLEGGSYFLPLFSKDRKPVGQLSVVFNSVNDQVKATVQPDPKNPPQDWPKSLKELPLYAQFQDRKGPDGKRRNTDAALVLEDFLKSDGRRRIGQMSVACPHKHKTTPLKGKPPFGEKLDVAPGGLFDQHLFGSIKTAGTTDDARNWAYIELPVEVPYPVKSFLSPKESADDFLRKHGIQSQHLPSIKVVPVFPPRYRMPFFLSDSTVQDKLIQEGYIPILRACRKYETAVDEDEKAGAVNWLKHGVEDLFRLLASHLNGKEGLIRHDGLGRRVDRSARLVIIPNPQLRWDEAGVPTAVLLELLGDELKRWTKEKRESGDLAEMISVMTASRGDAEILTGWSWRKSAKDQSLLDEGYKLLCRFLEARPDILIVLNRQPSLHRDSVQAFRPVPLPPQVGEVLQLCPLVCKGFGADFDGDEMAIHVPLSAAARDEATRMLPSQTMFSLATGKVLASYEQDFVLGLYWASREESGFKERLLKILPGDCCRQWAGKTVLDQGSGTDLLEHLAFAHPSQAPELIWKLSNLAYECCSTLGVSFGFYELAELATKCQDGSRIVLRNFDAMNPDATNEQLNKLVQKPLIELVKGGNSIFERPGLHFAAMALSGARGKQQVRQLVAARGFLSPGMEDFACPRDKFLVGSTLVHGMSAEEAFFGAMNSRSSMCDKKLGTRQAGYLTRRLVAALWPLRIVGADCGDPSDDRNPVTCRRRDGVCAACYGALPGGATPGVDFPAGLIAAQSIGERGTQLSMQSFHTGEKSFTIQTVLGLLDGEQSARFFQTPEGAMQFLAEMMESKQGEKKKPYKDLEKRHFQVLWRCIHASPERTLRSATQAVGLMTRIGFEQQAKNILVGVCHGECSCVKEPFARVLFNLFGRRNPLQDGGHHEQ